MEEKVVFNPELGVVKTETFSKAYPIVNRFIMENKPWEDSRDGKVKELLDFKTIITNPYRRLSGCKMRNENPFFLLAEAMWIFTGRRDVHFLSLFNAKMKDFSDDGKVFHAPYGFRIRHWGVRSEDKFCEENLHAAQGYDQLADAVKIFQNNPNTRQVVLSIWNADFDLGTKTKDIPCNDLVMLKIRNNKLITTIQNRSNDLHWGLPTNVFQFSFLTECLAACLGIELGTQTHNSQSLHIYEWNHTADRMLKIDSDVDLYDLSKERHIDFNFSHDIPGNRLRELDCCLNILIDNLERVERTNDAKSEIEDEINQLRDFSSYLYHVYQLLKIYLKYKHSIHEVETDEDKIVCADNALNAIEEVIDEEWNEWDVAVLARNWFVRKNKKEHSFLGKL